MVAADVDVDAIVAAIGCPATNDADDVLALVSVAAKAPAPTAVPVSLEAAADVAEIAPLAARVALAVDVDVAVIIAAPDP